MLFMLVLSHLALKPLSSLYSIRITLVFVLKSKCFVKIAVHVFLRVQITVFFFGKVIMMLKDSRVSFLRTCIAMMVLLL